VAKHKVHYRYGGETHLLLGLAAELVNNNRHAADFINSRVDGFDNFQAQLTRYSLALTSALSGVGNVAVKLMADAIAESENLVILYGKDGQTPADSQVLAQMCANLLLLTGHVGRPNNGLIAVWPHNNTQGAWDMGVRPNLLPGYQPVDQPGLDTQGMLEAVGQGRIQALYLAGADPVADTPGLADALRKLDFLVVQDLFMTETAKLAHVVLPAQSFAEREGTFTNGERWVQRFYVTIPPAGQSWPDWKIFTRLAEKLGQTLPKGSPASIMNAIAREVPLYQGMTYPALSAVEEQWPDVRGEGLYFGGTSYDNQSGLGRQWAVQAEDANARFTFSRVEPVLGPQPEDEMQFRVVPIDLLYDRGTMVQPSEVLHNRIPKPHVRIHPSVGMMMGWMNGTMMVVETPMGMLELPVELYPGTPMGVALIPRSLDGHGTWTGVALGRVMPRDMMAQMAGMGGMEGMGMGSMMDMGQMPMPGMSQMDGPSAQQGTMGMKK
jgi:NADH-quinone oxidoreductase subunit G